jgi:hypothetical protein
MTLFEHQRPVHASRPHTVTWSRPASAWNRIGIQRVSGVFFFASVSFW